MKLFSALHLVLVLSLIACTGEAAPPVESIRKNPEGVGIDGYSPVSYFTVGQPEQGSPEFSSVHEDVTYYFTSQAQVDLFEKDPQHYVPAHGGWCTLMMGGSGRRTPADAENFVIVDDRLMLFWSGDREQTKGLGLINWGRKTEGDPDKERQYIARADKQWDSFLSGKSKSRVFLYKPRDTESVSEVQREGAKIEY